MLRLFSKLPTRPVLMSPARNISSSHPRRNTPLSDPSAPPMLRYQSALPRLPVPPLASTLDKYLDTLRPLLSPTEFSNAQSALTSFAASPFAAELQRRLEARAADPNMKNWLADWWNDVAYMAYRDPVVVFVSYFYVHVNDKLRKTPASRAASLIKAMLPFRDLVESQRLEPEMVRGTPLCMDSYKWLFHSCRYPVKPADTAHKFDPATHNHVVFVRKNKFFAVPLTAPDGRELSCAELEVQIEKVIKLAGETKAVPVGVLTSDNRDAWTDARAVLLAASPANALSLEAIESALVIVALDDTAPVTREDISRACWVGDGRNRWYDKHQLIVFDNGRSGFLGEHSCMDGMPTLRMNEFMFAALAAGKVDLGPPRDTSTGTGLPAPQELTFKLDPASEQNIKAAEARFDALVGGHDLHVLHYEGYGASLIKHHRTSPDAWAQLVKQLAFHKLAGRAGITYESAQTRKYQRGRTEVIRAASAQSAAWVAAMADPAWAGGDAARAALFRTAVARHLEYAGWAADGRGVDRHLFGLKRMVRAADGEEVPAVLKDEAFSRSSHWELSTSQLSSGYLDGWGYGEVVPDGYGLAYSIGPDYIRWTVTCAKDSIAPGKGAAELRHYLAEAATETRAMMERAAKEEAKTKL